jgi:chromosome segregation ATPase
MPARESESAMTPSDRLETALKRLSAALDQIEAAAERRALADAARADLETELAVMQDDRARLAVELDGASARARALDHATTEASKRLERANATIRDVLGAVEPPREG